MDERVRMTHPKLPGREIRVRKTAVRSRERAGWKRVRETSSAPVVSKKES